MSKRKGGSRRRSRRIFRKNVRERGKLSLSRYFASFQFGDKVVLAGDSAMQRNLYHGRFHGWNGVITGKRGDCYELKIKDGGKEKLLIIHPVHLKKVS